MANGYKQGDFLGQFLAQLPQLYRNKQNLDFQRERFEYMKEKGIEDEVYRSQVFQSNEERNRIARLEFEERKQKNINDEKQREVNYNNDPTITMDSTDSIRIGMSVSGTGIPSGAFVSSITNTTTFELSASTTGGSVTNGTLTFGNIMKRMRDRIMYTPPNKYETFPRSFFIDVVKGDSDEYTALATYGDRLFAFKRKTLYVINIGSPSPANWFLESTERNKGVASTGGVFYSQDGIFWANRFGAFFFDGTGIKNLIKGKIPKKDWTVNATDNSHPLVAFHEETNSLYVGQNDLSLTTAGIGDFFVYSFDARGWAKAVKDDGTNRRLIFTALQETFLTYLKVSFFTAFFVTCPFILMQIWKFIAPGLYKHEKIAIMPYLILTPILFLLGGMLVYYLIMPLAIKFFLSFESTGLSTNLPIQLEAKVNEYLSLVMKLIFAFGLSFQLPVVLSLLARVGIVDSQFLKDRRKYVVVIIFAAAALLTPPDPITQIGLAIPLLILYELSIFSVKFIENKNLKNTDA